MIDETDLRRAACSALDASWGIRTANDALEYLGKSKFQVEARDGNRYVLTTFAPSERQWPGSIESVESLLIWLEDLDKEMDFPTPRPMRTMEGRLVGRGENAQGSKIYVSLLGWVPGKLLWDQKKALPESLPRAYLSQIGRILAHLHEHALGWDHESQYNRALLRRLGSDEIVSKIRVAIGSGHFTEQEGGILEKAAMATESHLGSSESFGLRSGMIHGDFHIGNCAVKDSQVGVFDFEGCCRGAFLSDVAKTLKFLVTPEMKATLVESYRSHRSLPDSTFKTIEAYLIQTRLDSLAQRAHRRYMPPFVLRVVSEAQAFLAKRPFLLS